MPINLTDSKPIEDKQTLKWLREEINHEEQEKLALMYQIYRKQRQLSDNLFDKWLSQMNGPLIKEIDSFLDNALIDSENTLWEESPMVYPAQITIGAQKSDHPATLNMIEKHIRKTRKRISILRLKPNRYTRNYLANMVDEMSGDRYILVIVEQVETLERTLLETIIDHLAGLLEYSTTEKAMLMICITGSFMKIDTILECTSGARLRKFTEIVQNPVDLLLSLPEELLRQNNLAPKISPTICPLMMQIFLENDCSVTNLRFTYQILQLYHCFTEFALVALTPGDSITSRPQILERIRNDFNIIKQPEGWDWKDSKKMSQIIHDIFKRHNVNHDSMMEQLKCYYILLKDLSEDGWPAYFTELYEEIGQFKDLGHSSRFVDAVTKINRIPIDRLLKRMENCLKSSNGLRYKPEMVQSIVYKYQQKLENNENNPKLVGEFVAELLLHIKKIRNPLDQLFHQTAYYTDLAMAREVITPSYRRSLATKLIDKDSYFGMLYDIISHSPSDICLADLFDEFQDAVKLRVQAKPNEQIERRLTSIKIKETPRKRDRGKSIAPVPAKKMKPNITDDEGLLKAIFIDLIETMDLQKYIRRDLRKSRRGFVARSAWLNVY